MGLPSITDEFISDCYYGLIHTANVPASGANIPPLYDGVGNKTSLSLGGEGNGASVTGCLSATCFNIGGQPLIDYIYPVGSVIFSAESTNPSTKYSGTTWERVAQGRFIVGVGIGNDGYTSMNVQVGNNSGEYTHKLTIAELPKHRHDLTHPDTNEQFYVINDGNFKGGGADTFRDQGPDDAEDGRYYPYTNYVGSDNYHNNTPPGFGLYIWKRTS